MRRKLIGICLFLAIFIIAACQTPAGRSPGKVIDDAAITSKVKAKLLNEGVLQGLGISVETFKGQVTLTGAVDTSQQKSKAEEMARDTEGVTGVNNLLQIKKQ